MNLEAWEVDEVVQVLNFLEETCIFQYNMSFVSPNYKVLRISLQDNESNGCHWCDVCIKKEYSSYMQLLKNDINVFGNLMILDKNENILEKLYCCHTVCISWLA